MAPEVLNGHSYGHGVDMYAFPQVAAIDRCYIKLNNVAAIYIDTGGSSGGLSAGHLDHTSSSWAILLLPHLYIDTGPSSSYLTVLVLSACLFLSLSMPLAPVFIRWAVGCLMHLLLTGTLPYSSDAEVLLKPSPKFSPAAGVSARGQDLLSGYYSSLHLSVAPVVVPPQPPPASSPHYRPQLLYSPLP
jgi:hypothetical protein